MLALHLSLPDTKVKIHMCLKGVRRDICSWLSDRCELSSFAIDLREIASVRRVDLHSPDIMKLNTCILPLLDRLLQAIGEEKNNRKTEYTNESGIDYQRRRVASLYY